MIQQVLIQFLAMFPALGDFVKAHPAAAVTMAFMGLALFDACLGGLNANRSGHFDRQAFGIEVKLDTATVIGALALLYANATTSGLTSQAFSLAVVAVLGPRCYILLLDVRDKLAELAGVSAPVVAAVK